MSEEQDTQPTQPVKFKDERTNKIVEAARKGAAQQIKRLKVLAKLIEQSEAKSRQESVNKSLTE